MTEHRVLSGSRAPVPLDVPRLSGIHAATVCPLHQDGSIDEAGLVAHVGSVSRAKGIVGLLVNGHAGEGGLLSEDERGRVLHLVRNEVPGLCHITAGVSAESTSAAVRDAQQAARLGADAVLLFPPNHWAMGVDRDIALIHHRAVAEACGLPLLIYKAPLAWGSASYDPDTIAALCGIDGVAGIKEGAWEVSAYEELLRRVRAERPGLSVMASGDEHLLACYQLGTDGSQVSLAALFPGLVTGLYDAAMQGDWRTARELHDRIYPLAREIYRRAPGYMANARLKSGLNIMGRIPSDRMKAPMRQLTPDEAYRLTSVIREVGNRV